MAKQYISRQPNLTINLGEKDRRAYRAVRGILEVDNPEHIKELDEVLKKTNNMNMQLVASETLQKIADATHSPVKVGPTNTDDRPNEVKDLQKTDEANKGKTGFEFSTAEKK